MFWCFAAGFDHMGNAYDASAAPKTTAVAVVQVVAVVVDVRMSPPYNHPMSPASTGIAGSLVGQGKEPRYGGEMTLREAASAIEMVPAAGSGRRFEVTRRVRLGDATPNGRARLDALARYLQDVANDDSRDAEWSDPHWWVVRRTVVEVVRFPVYLEEMRIVTWCGGIGSHWAERRTSIVSAEGEHLVEAAALWVHVDRETLQPSRVPADVADVLADSSGGRIVGARLSLKGSHLPVATDRSTWVSRFSDFDAVGHMNNAAYWEVVEERLALDRSLRAPLRAVVEHVAQVEPGESLTCAVASSPGEVSVLLEVEGSLRAVAWCGAR